MSLVVWFIFVDCSAPSYDTGPALLATRHISRCHFQAAPVKILRTPPNHLTIWMVNIWRGPNDFHDVGPHPTQFVIIGTPSQLI